MIKWLKTRHYPLKYHWVRRLIRVNMYRIKFKNQYGNITILDFDSWDSMMMGLCLVTQSIGKTESFERLELKITKIKKINPDYKF